MVDGVAVEWLRQTHVLSEPTPALIAEWCATIAPLARRLWMPAAATHSHLFAWNNDGAIHIGLSYAFDAAQMPFTRSFSVGDFVAAVLLHVSADAEWLWGALESTVDAFDAQAARYALARRLARHGIDHESIDMNEYARISGGFTQRSTYELERLLRRTQSLNMSVPMRGVDVDAARAIADALAEPLEPALVERMQRAFPELDLQAAEACLRKSLYRSDRHREWSLGDRAREMLDRVDAHHRQIQALRRDAPDDYYYLMRMVGPDFYILSPANIERTLAWRQNTLELGRRRELPGEPRPIWPYLTMAFGMDLTAIVGEHADAIYGLEVGLSWSMVRHATLCQGMYEIVQYYIDAVRAGRRWS